MLLPEKKLGNTNNFPFLFFVSESLLCLAGGGSISCIAVRIEAIRATLYAFLSCVLLHTKSSRKIETVHWGNDTSSYTGNVDGCMRDELS